MNLRRSSRYGCGSAGGGHDLIGPLHSFAEKLLQLGGLQVVGLRDLVAAGPGGVLG